MFLQYRGLRRQFFYFGDPLVSCVLNKRFEGFGNEMVGSDIVFSRKERGEFFSEASEKEFHRLRFVVTVSLVRERESLLGFLRRPNAFKWLNPIKSEEFPIHVEKR